jgi:hypothetical protein
MRAAVAHGQRVTPGVPQALRSACAHGSCSPRPYAASPAREAAATVHQGPSRGGSHRRTDDVSAFLLLCAYFLLKTVREPLILLQGGAEMKLYARAGQALLMVGVVHLYGELARRVGRMKLLAIVFLFFISNLAAFAVLARADVAIGSPFFLWVGVFSYTVVAQFWALAADIYCEDQGKRLFPIIGGGTPIRAPRSHRGTPGTPSCWLRLLQHDIMARRKRATPRAARDPEAACRHWPASGCSPRRRPGSRCDSRGSPRPY